MFYFHLLRHHEHLHEQQQQQQQKFSYKPSSSPKIPKPASITSTTTSSPILITNSNLPSPLLLESPPHTSILPPVPSSQLPDTSSSTNNFITMQQSDPVRKSAFQPYKFIKSAQSNHSTSGFAENNFMLPPSTGELLVPHNGADAEQLELFLSNVGKLNNGHYCYFCKKVYTRKYGLKIHIRTHRGYKPVKCKFCSRPFGDPSNVNKNMRLHKGDTPYRCHLCGKVRFRTTYQIASRSKWRYFRRLFGSRDQSVLE
ncbi:hypothetical protein PV327_010208 [Microctonus hyperodae]|uniref:C2H2-type domain-containing protein n=1 Tax=Microctonus hyperodae TaxID=165561 RepID=A0AA39FS95_MICHY|nr:hypothetical protein PV327_010208 [Microctonus hyperodae]